MHDRFRLAQHVADAATYFDDLCSNSGPAASARGQSTVHVRALHTVAQLLAGPRAVELYTPETREFTEDEHYTRTGSIQHNGGTNYHVSHWRNAGRVRGCIGIHNGPFSLHVYPTITELRELASAMNDTADDMEASYAQAMRERQPEAA